MVFKLSVIIPVLNEESNITKLCYLLTKELRKFDYEVIIVDDNSIDNTFKKIKEYPNKKIRALNRNQKNRDLSKSLIYGIDRCKFNNILIMDGDLQHNPKYITNFVNLFLKNKCDFVIGVRNFSKRNNLSIIRYFASKLLIFLFNTFLGFRTSDPMSGFFLFKKSFIKKKQNLYLGGYKFLSDLIYSTKKKIIICDYPIYFNRRLKNKSKMNYIILLHIINFFIIKLLSNVFSK